jgi:hypothetical protein
MDFMNENNTLDVQKLLDDVIENGVKKVKSDEGYMNHLKQQHRAEQTIEDGVKDTNRYMNVEPTPVEDTIQDGVKDTVLAKTDRLVGIEDTIENGVKEIKDHRLSRDISVISTIKNGVKHAQPMDEWVNSENIVSNVINDGVKETKHRLVESWEQKGHLATTFEITESINDAIENGVKETKEISNNSLMSEIFKVKSKQTIRDGVKELKVWKSNRCEEHGYFEFVDGIPTYTPMTQVKDVLENGVKELKELPDKSGEFRGYGDWYRTQGNMTKPHTEYVKEVIEDSYNHRGRIEGVIRNTDKDGI